MMYVSVTPHARVNIYLHGHGVINKKLIFSCMVY